MIGDRLPITVLSGYLGAGKTTLVNRLLKEDHGKRLMVLVNDFGAVNIDADLLSNCGANTMALTNGCVCCSLEGDLFDALNTVMDMSPRPEHLIVETSGIADPASIAAAAIAEPSLSYAGIVTLVDALNFDDLMRDPEVGPQVKNQVSAADLVLISRCPENPDVLERLADLGARMPMALPDGPVANLLLDLVPMPKGRAPVSHPAYVSWAHQSHTTVNRERLGEKLANRPTGLYRMKGTVLTDDGGYEIHVVGQFVQARRKRDATETRLGGLGPASQVSKQEIENWWTAA